MPHVTEAIASVVSTLFEVTLEAVRNLAVACCSLASKRHREKLAKEWEGGWKGKLSLSLSVGFGAFVIAAAVYFWWVILF